MGRLRRGMTVLQRQKLREEIMQACLDHAKAKAAKTGLSLACERGMQTWGEKAAQLHDQCRDEEPGGSGCLCVHHDDNRGGVESGAVAVTDPESS